MTERVPMRPKADTRPGHQSRVIPLGMDQTPKGTPMMKTRKILQAFALDLCAAAIGVAIIAVPMMFVGAMA